MARFEVEVYNYVIYYSSSEISYFIRVGGKICDLFQSVCLLEEDLRAASVI